MSFNSSLFVGEFDACQSAEQEVLAVLVGDQVVLVGSQVELALSSTFVGFGRQVGLEVLEGWQKFMLSDQAPDLAVGQEVEVRVLPHDFVQLRLFESGFCLRFGSLGFGCSFFCLVVCRHKK